MRSTFWPNRICERLSSVIRHTGLKLSPKRENSALSIKIIQNALFRSWAASFGQIAFLSVKVLKIGNLPQILFKTGKRSAFHENCTKRSFQVMRSTFWPNRIFESQTSKNRYTCLKFSPKRQTSAHSMKIVQNALFRSWAARFGQIAFLTGKVLTIVTLAWNLLQNGKTARFPWKLYKTLFSDHAQHVLGKSNFWKSNFEKSLHLSQILARTAKQCAFHENCTKRSFQVMGSTFWPNRIFERQSSHNGHTRLKFASKRENGALPWKLYKTLFSDHAQHVLAKSHFWASKFLRSSHWPQILFKTGKQCAFYENCTNKTLFLGHAQYVLAKSHLWASKFSNSSHWPEIVAKTGKQCAFYENYTKRSFQVMGGKFWPNRIFERQSSKNRDTGFKFYSKR